MCINNSGYTCPYCGQWVSSGTGHSCGSSVTVAPNWTFTWPTCWNCPFAIKCKKAVKPTCFEET